MELKLVVLWQFSGEGKPLSAHLSISSNMAQETRQITPQMLQNPETFAISRPTELQKCVTFEIVGWPASWPS